ncbi:MAG: methylmalonyl-CoA epimerase [Candidatus Thermoplasmatota archaeon]|nr:methylmalonyl-CoA epimerase [Candidatus Thermoplasmatota archaeon]
MTEGIDHIGIATNSLDSHSEFWNILGFIQGKDELNEEQGVKIRFFQPDSGGPKIELLEPLTPDSPIGKFLDKRGEGVQQIAVKTTDICTTISQLKLMGIRMINDVPVNGAKGTKIAFVHPSSTGGVLVELVEH